MNHGDATIVVDHPDLQRRTGTGRADEHRDGVVVRRICPPVVSKRVQHVVVEDTVLAGARLNVHSLATVAPPPN